MTNGYLSQSKDAKIATRYRNLIPIRKDATGGEEGHNRASPT